MERKYFKAHNETCSDEWTYYGSFTEEDIEPEGDMRVKCHEIIYIGDKKKLYYTTDVEYLELDQINYISKEEYDKAVAKIAEYLEKLEDISKILKNLL